MCWLYLFVCGHYSLHIVRREQIGVDVVDKIAIAVLQRCFHSGSRRVFQNNALGRHNHPALSMLKKIEDL